MDKIATVRQSEELNREIGVVHRLPSRTQGKERQIVAKFYIRHNQDEWLTMLLQGQSLLDSIKIAISLHNIDPDFPEEKKSASDHLTP